MNAGRLARRTGGTVVTGLVGATALEGLKRLARAGALRRGTVVATGWGLRGMRAAEAGAEATRLAAADIVAEARERVGETAPAPGAGAAPLDHEH